MLCVLAAVPDRLLPGRCGKPDPCALSAKELTSSWLAPSPMLDLTGLIDWHLGSLAPSPFLISRFLLFLCDRLKNPEIP